MRIDSRIPVQDIELYRENLAKRFKSDSCRASIAIGGGEMEILWSEEEDEPARFIYRDGEIIFR
jgi:hypothetical protein